MKISDLGEFGLIARLTEGLAARPDVALGVGDDAAVLSPPSGSQLVVTCDAQVEGQHFLWSTSSPDEIGHKALAVNLSDIAAMGATPLWALVSLLLPPALAVEDLDGVYAGMRALARRFDVAIVGGNIAATSGPFTIDITLIGACLTGHAITRAGGRPGDALFIVGTLGAAAASLLMLQQPRPASGVAPDALARARRAQVAPVPLVEAGRALAQSGMVGALMDVSDGLAADLAHLCARGGTGALIMADALPVDAAAEVIARALGRDPLALALFGGEDYALLGATPPESLERVLAAVRATGAEAHAIGSLTAAGAGIRLRASDGTVAPLEARGWDHLRGAS